MRKNKLFLLLALLLTAATGAWAQESATTYSVKMKDGTVDAKNWTITSSEKSAKGDAADGLTGLSEGDQVTLTYTGRLKVKGVKATSDEAPAAPLAAALKSGTLVLIQFVYGADGTQICAFTSNGDGTFTYDATNSVSNHNILDPEYIHQLYVESGKLIFKCIAATVFDPWDELGFQVTFDMSASTYEVWYGNNFGTSPASFTSIKIGGTDITSQLKPAAPATITVTWNNDDITGSGKSFTKDGVTLTAGAIDFMEKNFMQGGTFTTTLGNFTKIEVTTGYWDASGTGWSGSGQSATWTGTPASSVSFSDDIYGFGMGNTKFVFTIEPTN